MRSYRLARWGRIVLWILTIFTMGFLAHAGREEGRARDAADRAISARFDRGLCGVVDDVHDAAVTRVDLERIRLKNAIKYVQEGEDANLRRRIAETLPQIRASLRQAEDSVAATKPPAVCDQLREK